MCWLIRIISARVVAASDKTRRTGAASAIDRGADLHIALTDGREEMKVGRKGGSETWREGIKMCGTIAK